MHGFTCGLGNQTIARAHHLRVCNCARDRVAMSTVTALDAAQVDRKGSSEATTDNTSHFQDLQFSVASLGLLLSS